MAKYSVKSTCGARQPSNCTFFDSELPSFSKFSGEDCPISITDLFLEIYSEIDTIKSSLDITKIKNTCNVTRPDSVIGILESIENKLCSIESYKSKDDTNTGFDINKLDLKCLQTACGNSINNQTELLQSIINKLCPNG